MAPRNDNNTVQHLPDMPVGTQHAMASFINTMLKSCASEEERIAVRYIHTGTAPHVC